MYSHSFVNSASLYQDDEDDITLSRKIARFLSQYTWYCPSNELRTALDDAWAYFEHFTLPRYYTEIAAEALSSHNEDEDGGGSNRVRDQYPKAEPGEVHQPTKLYPIFQL